MMVWRLVSNFRASEEMLAPVGRNSSTDCRSSPDKRCGRPGMPALGHGATKAGLGAPYEEISLEFSHRIDHVHGELARRAGEIDTERQAVNPDAGLRRAPAETVLEPPRGVRAAL